MFFGLAVSLLVACSPGGSADPRADTVSDTAADSGHLDSAAGTDSGTVITPTAAAGKVALPEGVALKLADLSVRTGLGDAKVGADGAFSATVGGAGDSMALVVDAKGNVVLLGFIDPARSNRVDATSSVAAMVWQAFHLYGLPPDVRVPLLRLIEKHQYLPQLARAFEYALTEDPAVLMREDEYLRDQLVNVLNLMSQFDDAPAADTKQGAATAAGDGNNAIITAEPTAPQSGVLVGPNLSGNGMQVTNMSRRTAWYYVYKVGYEDDLGNKTEIEPELLKEGFVQSTNGLSGTVGTLKDALTGSLDFGPRALDEPIGLNVPDGQRRVMFQTVLAGAFIPFSSHTPKWFESGNALHQSWQTRAELMTTLSFVRDVLFPAVFSLALPIKGAIQGQDDFATWVGMAQLVTSQVPGVATQIANGEFESALKAVFLAIANNYELRNGIALTLVSIVETATEKSAGNFMDTFMKANFLVAAADLAVSAVDIGLVVSDLGDANALERWDVTAVRAKVLLQSSEDSLQPGTLDTTLSATVPGAGPGDFYCYKWTLEGPGELSAFLPGPDTGSAKVAVSEDADMLYLVDEGALVDGQLAVVTCEPYLKSDGAKCAYPPAGELVGEGKLAIMSRKEKLEPCPAAAFDLGWWQEEDGGMQLSVSGQAGGKVTVTVQVPEDPTKGGGRRDIMIWIPGVDDPDPSKVTLSGDTSSANVREETWIQWFKQDETKGPVWFANVADVRFSGVGNVSVTVDTVAPVAKCDSGEPGAKPCCPHWEFREPYGDVLIGPLVYAQVNGVGRSIALVPEK